jgi:Tfp pilus assembly protein PilV
MSRRPAITLLEVLVAIFVTGIGMLALLVLFPLAATSMAQAIKDDRCAQCAGQAAALANAFGLRQDGLQPDNSVTSGSVADNLAKGNPVFIDAIGINNTSAGTTLGGNIPRVSPSFVTSSQTALRWFTLQDEMTFIDNNGAVVDATHLNVDRPGRFSWAFMARRPNASVPSVVDLAVVVFYNRDLQLSGGETTYTPAAAATAGSTSITISYSGNPPNIRAGGWILDASASVAGTDPSDLGNYHAFFYRVTTATDLGGGQMQLDLQSPLRAALQTTGVVVVMEDVAEVFERRTGWHP